MSRLVSKLGRDPSYRFIPDYSICALRWHDSKVYLESQDTKSQDEHYKIYLKEDMSFSAELVNGASDHGCITAAFVNAATSGACEPYETGKTV